MFRSWWIGSRRTPGAHQYAPKLKARGIRPWRTCGEPAAVPSGSGLQLGAIASWVPLVAITVAFWWNKPPRRQFGARSPDNLTADRVSGPAAVPLSPRPAAGFKPLHL